MGPAKIRVLFVRHAEKTRWGCPGSPKPCVGWGNAYLWTPRTLVQLWQFWNRGKTKSKPFTASGLATSFGLHSATGELRTQDPWHKETQQESCSGKLPGILLCHMSDSFLQSAFQKTSILTLLLKMPLLTFISSSRLPFLCLHSRHGHRLWGN